MVAKISLLGTVGYNHHDLSFVFETNVLPNYEAMVSAFEITKLEFFNFLKAWKQLRVRIQQLVRNAFSGQQNGA